MSMNIFLTVFFACKLLSAAWGQTIADVGASEYPFLARVKWATSEPVGEVTDVAVFVSGKYLLASSSSRLELPASLEITDRTGTVRVPVQSVSLFDGTFVYFKVCDKYKGAMYPMRVSDYNNLATDNTAAKLVFYNASSNVPRTVNVTVQDKTACTADLGNSLGSQSMCVYSDPTPGFCTIFYPVNSNDAWLPLLAIGTQPQGFLDIDKCSGGNSSGNWIYTNIAAFRSNLIDPTLGIPKVDITV